MKIGIVTVRSHNTGSYWQAYALQETLKKKGYDVCFIKTEFHSQSKFLYRFLQAVKYTLIGKPKKAYSLLKVYSSGTCVRAPTS